MLSYIESVDKIVTAILTGGFFWVLRTVFTNNKKVDRLELLLEVKEKDAERRHKETKESIEGLVKSNDRAVDNQQKMMEKILDIHNKHHE